jgi:hypothetical protein
MVSPLHFYVFGIDSRLWRACLVFGSIGNAAADGKRLRVIDTLAL